MIAFSSDDGPFHPTPACCLPAHIAFSVPLHNLSRWGRLVGFHLAQLFCLLALLFLHLLALHLHLLLHLHPLLICGLLHLLLLLLCSLVL